MSRQRYRPVIITIVVVLAVILINSLAFNGKITDPLISLFSRPLGYMWSNLGFLQAFSRDIAEWRVLSEENDRLKNENQFLTARLAIQEEIQLENSYLRNALELPPQTKKQLSEAGIFGIVFGPEGHRALLNKGESDGVKIGSIVITSQGEIVGSVEEVMPKTSRVRLVQDRSFEITASVVGRPTVGIIRGAGEGDLLLELVTQGDPIIEGDIITSSGADRYPGGLVLGTVSHVVESETSLFKEVRVEPAFKNPAPMKVFFIR